MLYLSLMSDKEINLKNRMARILLENITKVFDDKVKAVSNFSLEVADGEFMVIVGPSGCGKTTLLRILTGLEEPTSGTIKIGDTVVNNIAPKDRDIAMVFQNYALYPHMTAFQNLSFGLKLRKYPKSEIKKRVEDTAIMLGIKGLLHRKPKALSGGQRQRVALGRAIVQKPKAFLFDEPLSNLDAKLRILTRIELKALHRRIKTTTVYVTHDQEEAMTLGDRICVMFEGAVQQVAKPMEVYDNPINRFVAGFIGTPPMNFFNGQIGFDQDNPEFIIRDDVTIALPKDRKKDLSKFIVRKTILGVRPENILHKPIDGQSKNEIFAKVDFVQHIGGNKDVYLINKSNQKFTVRVNPHLQIEKDTIVKMYFDVNHVHIFEPGISGENLNFF